VAAHFGSLSIVRYLLEEHGVKMNNDSPTPMDMASKQGKFEVLQYLVEMQGYHQGRTLHNAARNGGVEMLEYCIAQGANTELIEGATALHFVVYNCSKGQGMATLKALSRHGANPLALTMRRDSNVLMTTRNCAVASHLVERDYWLAREGRHFNPTVARKLLCARNKEGQTALTAAHDNLLYFANRLNQEMAKTARRFYWRRTRRWSAIWKVGAAQGRLSQMLKKAWITT
jgi:ankyrin repeat protein